MVIEQFRHPSVNARRDRPVRGQEERVRERQHQLQRAQVIPQRVPGLSGLVADGGSDSWQNVVARKKEVAAFLVVHDMSAGVAGRLYHSENPVASLQLGTGIQPPIR